ncbi:MAG: hypothetical protein CFE37_03600 [Alphaproteobacteria bacterium PA4]|nr:MAG: hypothetical protein CFE37_03600 [Alphaproteobacteria bacterium PA4]
MSVAAAYRLRRHPLAADFRRCWDEQLAGVWQRAEQTALDRMMNGTVETLVRNGEEVMRRAKPCSDSFLLAMLRQQLRRAELALAAAESERAQGWSRREPPPTPEALETEALLALHGRMASLPDAVGWDAPEVTAETVDSAPPPVVPAVVLAPANGRIRLGGRAPRLRPVRVAAVEAPAGAAPPVDPAAAEAAEARAALAESLDEFDWRKYRERAAARDLPGGTQREDGADRRRDGPRVSRTWD